MAQVPNYAATPKIGVAVISTANTNRDGSGTLGTVFNAGTNGSLIDAIEIQATGTTTAGMVRLFLHDGTDARLIGEVPVLAVTPSATVPAWSAIVNSQGMNNGTIQLPIRLPTGWSLRASTHNAETFNIVALGGDF